MSAKSSISLVTYWISIELPRRSQKSILDCCFDWRHPLNARGTNSTKFKSFFKRLVLKWITMHDISVRVVFAGISIKKVWRRCFRFSVNANEHNFGNFPLSEKFRFSLVYRPAFLDIDWSILVLRIVAGRILLYDEMSRCIALHCIASHRIAAFCVILVAWFFLDRQILQMIRAGLTNFSWFCKWQEKCRWLLAASREKSKVWDVQKDFISWFYGVHVNYF